MTLRVSQFVAGKIADSELVIRNCVDKVNIPLKQYSISSKSAFINTARN